MYKKRSYINIKEIRSHWYDTLLEEWHPDPEYIDYLKRKIKKKKYLPAIVLVGGLMGMLFISHRGR